ncbi:D-glycero-beta-D-manno-heptose 1-phosphate adenylyltransferase [Goodfellowiella coeruleoviolacea]|uniref:D-glycero-beta-D-manno-heptose 1-phosphate adenylyltransferase n=1 Tax=Goodfellowiella coeruleoviolacea TaxID=334858 RepID=A0AAE3GB03_9PSEU|nr:D-glycero-beta-D-manno-heptose 1-phosphate adenylyltransferase [Goodfellowiella coeruleoviolacea]MCP2163739.1 rfaE bifunctional protein, domain I/rfaE bifunctional protein, domain II [Goodfellowiella coeruleoviolacea]
MNLVVVGDTLLDVDLVGEANRLCPDAPAPVLDVAEQHSRPGGAGLAASLAAADGASVCLVTALADDEDGRQLRSSLTGLSTVAGTLTGPTPAKIRLRCAGQSLARIDRGSARPVDGSGVRVSDEMLDAVRGADAVLVSDYGRGVTADRRLWELLAGMATRVPVVWDPHPRGATPVPNARLVTPNLAEAQQASGVRAAGLAGAEQAAKRLRERWRVRAVSVTLGGRGALLEQGGVPVVVPAPATAVTDPCGAGDQFAATATQHLAGGAAADEAVRAAVTAASRFLGQGGAAGFRPGRRRAGHPDQLDQPAGDGLAQARRVVAETRAAGGTVVATGGCFDLLHAGHARTLAAARALGDCLVVCVNSDRSVRRLKGPDRPITTEADRVELLRSLRCVDAVVVFDQDTPHTVLSELRPDLWVKGGDYSVDSLPEARLVRGWGGQAVVVPYHPGRSTSRLATVLAKVG